MICKQASAQRQQLGSSSRGQEAEEADAHEATRQHMQEKASEELLAGERHLPLLIAVGIVLPEESDLAVVEGEQTMVGNGHAMGVASQVAQHALGSAERRLA